MASTNSNINPAVLAAESHLLELKRREAEDYTKAYSEVCYKNTSLQKQLDEMKALYVGQLHIINKWGTFQSDVNAEIHHSIVQPLHNEIQQVRQQLLVEQAKFKIGLHSQETLQADLTLRYQRLYEEQVQKTDKETRESLEQQFEQILKKRIEEKVALLSGRVTQQETELQTLQNTCQDTWNKYQTLERTNQDTVNEFEACKIKCQTLDNNYKRLDNAYNVLYNTYQNKLAELNAEQDSHRRTQGENLLFQQAVAAAQKERDDERDLKAELEVDKAVLEVDKAALEADKVGLEAEVARLRSMIDVHLRGFDCVPR